MVAYLKWFVFWTLAFRGPGLNPGRGTALGSWAVYFIVAVSPFT